MNYGRKQEDAAYHGKAINLQMGHRHTPFPVTFLIHERGTRACWPFVNEPNDIPTIIQFQDWMAPAVGTGNAAASGSHTVNVAVGNQGHCNMPGNMPGNSTSGSGAAPP